MSFVRSGYPAFRAAATTIKLAGCGARAVPRRDATHGCGCQPVSPEFLDLTNNSEFPKKKLALSYCQGCPSTRLCAPQHLLYLAHRFSQMLPHARDHQSAL
jgi:hypothetical protein